MGGSVVKWKVVGGSVVGGINKTLEKYLWKCHASNKKKQITKFHFPLKNAESKKQWISFVNRRDWIATKHSVPRELHFEEIFAARWKMDTTVVNKSCTHCLTLKTFK